MDTYGHSWEDGEMGPYTADVDPIFATLRRLRELERAHPEVSVSRPSATGSGLWELSLPDSACAAFDSVERLVDALELLDDRAG
jgi:hypothetical protein